MSYETIDGDNNPATLKSTLDSGEHVLHHNVDTVAACALPTGASTETTLAAADTKLGTVNTNLTTLLNRLSGELQQTVKVTVNAAANASDPNVLATASVTAGKRVLVEGFSIRSLSGGTANHNADDIIRVEFQEDSTGDLICVGKLIGFDATYASLPTPLQVGADDRGVKANIVVLTDALADNSTAIVDLEITLFYREI